MYRDALRERVFVQPVVSSSQDTVVQETSCHSAGNVKIQSFRLKRTVHASVCLDLDVPPTDSLPLFVMFLQVSRLYEFGRFVLGHGRCLLTMAELISPTHEFSAGRHVVPFSFVLPRVLPTLDVSPCQILCYDPSVRPAIAPLQPRLLIFFLVKTQFSCIRSTVRVHLFSASDLEQHP
jgi:hypothetical protein